MGMRAKLRHVSARQLKAAKTDPAKFYRNLYGIQGPVDRAMLQESLGQQLGAAIRASPFGKDFADMPEVRRMAEANRQCRAPDPADHKVMAQKMWELLPKIGFRPNLSQFMSKVTKIPQGLELEKSWHCLHFLFSGKVWETGKAPIEKAILGGTEIPDAEGIMGYGPARYLDNGEVKKIAAALEHYPIDQRARNFDPSAAANAKIYSPNHSAEELVRYFDLLKSYYREAASKKHAMLIWIE